MSSRFISINGALIGFPPFSQKHLRCLGSRLVASAAEERDKRRWTGLGREDGGERNGRRMGEDGAGEGRWRGARREVHGWGRGWGGKMEGSETEARGWGRGREAHGWGRGWGGKMEGSETGGGELCCAPYTMVLGVQNVRNACDRQSSRGRNGRIVASSTWLHHRHHCGAQVERSMGREVSGAVLRG